MTKCSTLPKVLLLIAIALSFGGAKESSAQTVASEEILQEVLSHSRAILSRRPTVNYRYVLLGLSSSFHFAAFESLARRKKYSFSMEDDIHYVPVVGMRGLDSNSLLFENFLNKHILKAGDDRTIVLVRSLHRGDTVRWLNSKFCSYYKNAKNAPVIHYEYLSNGRDGISTCSKVKMKGHEERRSLLALHYKDFKNRPIYEAISYYKNYDPVTDTFLSVNPKLDCYYETLNRLNRLTPAEPKKPWFFR